MVMRIALAEYPRALFESALKEISPGVDAQKLPDAWDLEFMRAKA